MCGTAFFLVIISYTNTYGGALTCMAAAVACCGFHNSGILVNPQDIAPKHAGSVFGIMNMAGAIPGIHKAFYDTVHYNKVLDTKWVKNGPKNV